MNNELTAAWLEDIKRDIIPHSDLGCKYPDQLNEALDLACAALRRIAEDDKAREEGRLVELPIPVGGCLVAYGIYEEEGVPAHIVTIECDRLEGLEIWPTGEIVVNVDGWEIGRSDIGKTVFLTRQESEAALGGGEGG